MSTQRKAPQVLLSVMKIGTSSRQEYIYQKKELIKPIEEIIKCPRKDWGETLPAKEEPADGWRAPLCEIKKEGQEKPRAAQWLGLGAFTAGAQVWHPVAELRSRKPWGAAKKQKKQAQG